MSANLRRARVPQSGVLVHVADLQVLEHHRKHVRRQVGPRGEAAPDPGPHLCFGIAELGQRAQEFERVGGRTRFVRSAVRARVVGRPLREQIDLFEHAVAECGGTGFMAFKVNTTGASGSRRRGGPRQRRHLGAVAFEPSLGRHARVERRCHWRHERAEAEDRNPGSHDELVLLLEDARIVGVESDDQSGRDADAVGVKALHLFDEVAVQVLPFVRLAEALLVRRFEADVDVRQSRLEAHREELVIANGVDGDLRDESHPVGAVARVPVPQRVEELFRAAAVDGEVVVGEKDAAVAEAMQERELGDDGGGRLVALLAAEVLDDVAELALERTAARRLHASDQRAVVAVSLPRGNGADREVDRGADVLVVPRSGREIGEELVGDRLDFAAH